MDHDTFQLKAYLAERRQIVDAALDREMPAADTRPAVLHDAMRYSIFSGGKRVRPVMCMAAAEAAGAPPEAAILPALAVEFLHTYTLIHDDLPCMDDDDERRGKPTSHKLYGEANAVLAGDALQTLAFETLARIDAPPPYTTADLVGELALAAGSRGVIGGQVEDIAAGTDTDAATVDFIHLHKTADLFRASMRLGAMAGAANAMQLDALTRYGVALGLAFQITDDLLDADGAQAGDQPDELSYLAIASPQQARRRAAELIAQATEALAGLDKSGAIPLAAIAAYVLKRDH